MSDSRVMTPHGASLPAEQYERWARRQALVTAVAEAEQRLAEARAALAADDAK